MKVFNDVRSTAIEIPAIEVGIDTVYVRENITDVPDKDYPNLKNIGKEIHYGKDEYIELIAQNTETLEEENMINMVASVENYEKNLQLEEENNNTMVALTEMFEMLGGL